MRGLNAKIRGTILDNGSNEITIEDLRNKKVPARHHESQLQQACVRWFRVQYPKLARCLFSIPNEGKRGRANSMRMKAEGMVAGVPDLFLTVPAKPYHGLFIEMKWGDNKPTANQVEFMREADHMGYKTVVVWSFEQFENAIKTYLKF